MSDLVLSIDELKTASRTVQPGRIARWLRENGFTYKLSVDGYPVVSRAHFERVMGGATEAQAAAYIRQVGEDAYDPLPLKKGGAPA